MNGWYWYRKAVVIPGAIAWLLTAAFIVWDNRNYKSEWLTAESVISISLLLLTAIALSISLLCCLLLLNKKGSVRRRPWLSGLCWVGLPGLVLGFFLVYEITGITMYQRPLREALPTLLMTLPYLIALPVTFVQFRKQMKAV